ncbi:MAG: 3-phosphoshikimate 1-carboxyvinyltransferase, partial [Pseudomonadota bacterium]
FHISKTSKYGANQHFVVEGDASSASYFLAAAAIKGGSVTVNGVGSASIQGDKDFALVLEKMGAKVLWDDYSITIKKGELQGIDLDLNHIPDAAMTIATTALFAKGPTTIRNIYNWRVKETDRLHAMATELRKVGAVVEEGEDFIHIVPPDTLKHAEIDTYDDHRMAMCFSLVALDDNCGVTINDPGCTSKTFPDYFSMLAQISQK